jgi:hypothetical protein
MMTADCLHGGSCLVQKLQATFSQCSSAVTTADTKGLGCCELFIVWHSGSLIRKTYSNR